MPNFKAAHIEDLEPGSVVEIKGRRYLRINDHEDLRSTGWLADLETGWIGQWYRLIDMNELVTSDARWSCSPCSQVGAIHCSDPANCGAMRLRKNVL